MGDVVVITGASGFVGSTVLRRMQHAGATRVIGLARAPKSGTGGQFEWLQACLSELSTRHWDTAGVTKVDLLLHIGAYTPKAAVDRDAADEIVKSNVLGTHALLNSLPEAPKRIVFCSTLDVYADSAFAQPIHEGSATGPAGLYGASKLFGESLVRAYAERKHVEHVCLRLTHVYGPGEDQYKKLIPETIRRILAHEAPRLYGDGCERRDLLYVDDAAEAIIRAGTVAAAAGKVINVASGVSLEVAEIVDLIGKQTNYRGEIESHPRAQTPHSIQFDVSLMRRTLGSWAFVPLAEGLRREISWVREKQ